MGKGVRLPAEWEPQDSIILCWPHSLEWGEELKEMRGFTRNLISKILPYQKVELIHHPDHPPELGLLAKETDLILHELPHDDLWIRDYGPFYVFGPEGLEVRQFSFNGYGEKFYPWDGDDRLAQLFAEDENLSFSKSHLILEGGAIETNGLGLAMTTSTCLKGKRRNEDLSLDQIKRGIKEHLGIKDLLVFPEGLVGDHTDGHVDNVARFIAPHKVLMARPEKGDPNEERLLKVEKTIRAWRGEDGQRLEVDFLPSLEPGVGEGELFPRSYLNFIQVDGAVFFPTFGEEKDEEAEGILSRYFLGFQTFGVDCNLPIRQGGALHCMTRHKPAQLLG